ncbi:MAG: hypothetical protein SPI74_00495 [Eubacterium sp.]|nr:hypothetical protein [Eubacterium sp.]
MKYYYFRFIDTFFKQSVIRQMKHIPIFGYHFIVIYLELCALATEEHGILKVPIIGEVPYVTTLAKDIGEDPEVLGQAFTYFIQKGLVEKVEDDYMVNLIIPYVINNTGKGSTQADKKRLEYTQMKQRLLGADMEYRQYGLCKKVSLTTSEYESLKSKNSNLKELIEKLDLEKAMGKEFALSDYDLLKKMSNED